MLAETLNPQVRQVVKTYAPGFGMEVVEVPHTGGTTDPALLAAASQDAAAVIFQQPNAFGCLEPAPELAAAAAEGGALPVAHVDLASLGLLEAPGNYGCAMAIGEGQSIGNYQSYGGPHYGFLAARNEFIRRMPGRIVGETTDLEGKRGFVLTLQTREQHIRREKATSNITTNQTLLALGGLITLCWLGPEGLRELGETCTALAAYAKERVGLPLAFDRPTFKEVAFRTPIPAREVVARAREHGVHPGLPARPRLSGPRRRPARRAHREAHARRRRPPRRGARGGDGVVELIYEKSQAGAPRGARPVLRACPCRRCPAELRRERPPRLPEVPENEIVRHFTALADRNFGIDTGFYPLGSCTMKHNPRVNERVVGAARLPRPASAAGGGRGPGRARADVGARRGSSPRSPASRP